MTQSGPITIRQYLLFALLSAMLIIVDAMMAMAISPLPGIFVFSTMHPMMASATAARSISPPL